MSCDIGHRQNSESTLRLLKARAVVWDKAASWQMIQLFCTVFVPTLSSLIAIFIPSSRPYAVALASFMTVLDALAIDRWYRERIRAAANIGEQLDVELFGLPWNQVSAGPPLGTEAISAAAKKWKGDPELLLNWYPPAVAATPIHVARALCQRSMVWFDTELRQGFGSGLIWLGLTVFALLTALGIAQGLTLSDWLLSVLAPTAPVATWIARERVRQLDATRLNRRSFRAAEQLLQDISEGKGDEREFQRLSRDIQTGILSRRTSNSRIPNWVYRRMRPKLESLMHEGVAQWLIRLGYAGKP